MSDVGGSVTLIFYSIGKDFWKEPFLNLVAAGATMSSFTHVELAIGDEAGNIGQMSNVCRIFNDDIGVELTSRTGRNPQYSYVQLGCSKRSEEIMLSYAKSLVGRPFSNVGMFRSIFFPRTTDGQSFFCAELVASILKKGGLMSHSSNPGSATPQSLHKMYKNKAALTGNPFLLRGLSSTQSHLSHAERAYSQMAKYGAQTLTRAMPQQSTRRNCNSPPRAALRVLSDTFRPAPSQPYFRLTL